jgi:predicted nuclease of predicted toxin-antitoxin system
MPLLIDENHSAKLTTRLTDLFPGSKSVGYVGLLSSSDVEVWEHAKLHGFTLLTRDDDFVSRSILYGHPPKVIFITLGNCSTDQIETLIRWRADSIRRFLEDDGVACLALA